MSSVASWPSRSLAITLMFSAREARAQTTDLAARIAARGPRDLVDSALPAGSLTVPPLPLDHVTERHGPLTISYPRALKPVVENALRRAEGDARAVAAQFGMREIPPLAVRLVADPEMMRRLAPRRAPPPAYAVGVAYPAVRLALVSSMAPRTRSASNVAQVLRHELSHLLLAEATHHARRSPMALRGHRGSPGRREHVRTLSSARVRELDGAPPAASQARRGLLRGRRSGERGLRRVDGLRGLPPPHRRPDALRHPHRSPPRGDGPRRGRGADLRGLDAARRRRVAPRPRRACGLRPALGGHGAPLHRRGRAGGGRAHPSTHEEQAPPWPGGTPKSARRTSRWMFLTRPALRLVPQPVDARRRGVEDQPTR